MPLLQNLFVLAYLNTFTKVVYCYTCTCSYFITHWYTSYLTNSPQTTLSEYQRDSKDSDVPLPSVEMWSQEILWPVEEVMPLHLHMNTLAKVVYCCNNIITCSYFRTHWWQILSRPQWVNIKRDSKKVESGNVLLYSLSRCVPRKYVKKSHSLAYFGTIVRLLLYLLVVILRATLNCYACNHWIYIYIHVVYYHTN